MAAVQTCSEVAWALCAIASVGCAHGHRAGDSPMSAGVPLYADDFRHGVARWRVELERGGSVVARDGVLDIDVPGGATVWFEPALSGPIQISYEAMAVSTGGANDRVSDLNCFWMATDARDPNDLFAVKRSGAFADYNALRCYYVGLGGNRNTTTRFRRYIGSPTTRPLLPEHDLRSPRLEPNVPVRIRLIAEGACVRFYPDGQLLFDFVDSAPYTRGRFAFRTVSSHLRIRDFRVCRSTSRP